MYKVIIKRLFQNIEKLYNNIRQLETTITKS